MSYPTNAKGTALQRFSAKYVPVPWTGCWIWIGASGRYGCMQYQGKSRDAHRIAWMLHHGEIPESMCVCHTCDEPLCVNPAHLFLGTNKQNTADMINKGRHRYATWNAPSGENHWQKRKRNG